MKGGGKTAHFKTELKDENGKKPCQFYGDGRTCNVGEKCRNLHVCSASVWRSNRQEMRGGNHPKIRHTGLCIPLAGVDPKIGKLN